MWGWSRWIHRLLLRVFAPAGLERLGLLVAAQPFGWQRHVRPDDDE